MKKIFLSTIIFFLTKIIFAQFLTKIPFEQLTVKNGLLSNNITAITQDGIGLLYIGTDKGLNIYDGYRFDYIKFNSEIYVTSIIYTPYPKPTLWVGTWGNGLIQISLITKKKTIYTTATTPKLTSNFITSLAEINKKLYIGTSSGLTILNLKDKKVYHKIISNSTEGNYIAVIKKYNNKIWIGTKAGLYLLDPKTDKISSFFLNDLNITALNFNNGSLWIGTPQGVYIYNLQKDILSSINNPKLLSQSYITSIFISSSQEIWIGTQNNGLFIIDNKSHDIQNIINNPFKLYSLKSNYITTIFESSDKTIWIGTYDAGLFKYSPIKENINYFSFYIDSGVGKDILCLSKDKNGNIWIGTKNSGLKKWNPRNEIFLSYVHNPNDSNSISDDEITSIYVDREGRIWIGTKNSGIEIFNPQKGIIIKRFNELKNIKITDIVEDQKGNMWIGTLGKGVIKISPSLKIVPIKSLNNNINRFVTKLKIDNQNRLWIGTINGIYLYIPNENSTKDVLSSSQSTEVDWIYSIYQDEHNNIWISTKNGDLYKISSNLIIEKISDSILLDNNIIYDISGYDNVLWMTTKKGIVRYNLNTQEKIFFNHNIIHTQKGYIPILKYNSHFYTISDNGLISFDTNLFNIDTINPNIEIEKIEVNNKTKKTLDNITINGLKNKLKIFLRSIDFLSRKYTYEYKLLGYDTSYHSNNNGIIYYNNLPEGDYKLVIKYINNNGKVQVDTLPVNIQVKPLFTETKLYELLKTSILIISFLVVLLILMLYFLNRQRKLLKIIKTQNKELANKNIELKEKIKVIKEQAKWISKLNEELAESYEEVQATNKKLEEQEEILIEQAQEIQASLEYARHIQLLLLQNSHDIEQIFKHHFLIYLPKGIISGDFYWITQIKSCKIAIVGDATGHGVPGALMAILGLSIIKKIVNEYNISEPQDILNRTKMDLKNFINRYNYDEEGFNLEREGFSLSVIKMDTSNKIIKYASAGGFAYLVNIPQKELYKLRTSRKDITFALSDVEYTQEKISYNQEIMLYMFTDGYPDQIGGPQGKKFKYKRLRDLFIAISNKSLKEQKNILEETFHRWINYPSPDGQLPSYFQIDDVTILGIKLES